MQVTYNGFTGELVKLEIRKELHSVSEGAVRVCDLTLYDREKQATISFACVKLEDVRFTGGAVAFGG